MVNQTKLSLLYVEDEEMVRKNAVEYLTRICKKVIEAKDGKVAISLWKEHKPDIIITDIGDTCHTIHKNRRCDTCPR